MRIVILSIFSAMILSSYAVDSSKLLSGGHLANMRTMTKDVDNSRCYAVNTADVVWIAGTGWGTLEAKCAPGYVATEWRQDYAQVVSSGGMTTIMKCCPHGWMPA